MNVKSRLGQDISITSLR